LWPVVAGDLGGKAAKQVAQVAEDQDDGLDRKRQRAPQPLRQLVYRHSADTAGWRGGRKFEKRPVLLVSAEGLEIMAPNAITP
jgi:hypothetical protein